VMHNWTQANHICEDFFSLFANSQLARSVVSRSMTFTTEVNHIQPNNHISAQLVKCQLICAAWCVWLGSALSCQSTIVLKQRSSEALRCRGSTSRASQRPVTWWMASSLRGEWTAALLSLVSVRQSTSRFVLRWFSFHFSFRLKTVEVTTSRQWLWLFFALGTLKVDVVFLCTKLLLLLFHVVCCCRCVTFSNLPVFTRDSRYDSMLRSYKIHY